MKITGTFLDEISHDIPHQNWGRKEWDQDFAAMKSIGIDTVILIRCGHRRFITYPSKFLMKHEGCYCPPVDLVDLFLELAEKYGMTFYFGLYDSGKYWHDHKYEREMEISRAVAERSAVGTSTLKSAAAPKESSVFTAISEISSKTSPAAYRL